jgi:hypothetical protein
LSMNHYCDCETDEEIDLKKALERTRMVVSTTQTLLRDNVDRVRNAVVEYSKGKAIRHAFCILTARRPLVRKT